MNLKEGTMLMGGTYRIIKVLGHGGFGITYLAENVKLEKSVAIKEFFPKDYCTRDGNSLTVGAETNREFIEKLKERFVKEAKNIARLDHPGIVVIHDIFQENGTAYYVMDYIEGESLSELVRRSGPLPEKQALEYIQKVGVALSYIHSRKMTHFDVKPANIMLKRQNRQPVLIDFGLSKQFDQTGSPTSSVLQAVSHGYSSLELYNPETIQNFTPSPDIYALGATLYYLMTGATPPNATVVYEEGLTIPGNVPEKYHAVIRKAMNPVRKESYPTVNLFLVALSSPENRGDVSAASNKTSGLQKADGRDTPKPPPVIVKPPLPDATQIVNPPSYNNAGREDTDNNAGRVDKKKVRKNKRWFVPIGALIIFLLIAGVVVFVNYDSIGKYIESIGSETENVDENAGPDTAEPQHPAKHTGKSKSTRAKNHNAAASKKSNKKESKKGKNNAEKGTNSRSSAAEPKEAKPAPAKEPAREPAKEAQKPKENVVEKSKESTSTAKDKLKEKLKK